MLVVPVAPNVPVWPSNIRPVGSITPVTSRFPVIVTCFGATGSELTLNTFAAKVFRSTLVDEVALISLRATNIAMPVVQAPQTSANMRTKIIGTVSEKLAKPMVRKAVAVPVNMPHH